MTTVDTAASMREFAEAMSALASGVAVVTCWVEGRPWGMTVTAFTSVSNEPPMVLVSLGQDTVTARAIEAADGFGVSILAADQAELAQYASTPGAAKFLEPFVDHRDRESASPVVAGALAHLDCSVVGAVGAADHTVFFADVLSVRIARRAAALLYHRRSYGWLAS